MLDALEVWPQKLLPCMEKLLLCHSEREKARVLERFLYGLLHPLQQEDAIVDTLAQLLYYNHATLTVQDAADRMGYSRRQLLRICRRNFGLSPKQYLSLARFNKVLRKTLLNKSELYLPYALDAGYFDQAHFIHQCKEFTGHTPQQFLNNIADVSHFYNTSLNAAAYISATVS